MGFKKFSNSILDYFTTRGIKDHYSGEEYFSREFNVDGYSLNLNLERIERNRKFYTTSKNFSNVISSGFLFSTIYFENPWLLAPVAFSELYRGLTYLIDLSDRDGFLQEKKKIEWNLKNDNFQITRGERGLSSLEEFLREDFQS